MSKAYDVVYKMEVCKRAVVGGETVPALSRELGINKNALYSWIRRYRQNSAEPFAGRGHIYAENVRLNQLQRENQELREENEILKKAAAYFEENQK